MRFGGAECPRSDAEDIHTWLEAQLVEQAGDAGRRIHTARSRNDQVATLLSMFMIDCGGQAAEAFAKLARTFCEQGKAWSELVFPLQTHCQFAAPGSVGFWSLRYATAFTRLHGRAKWLVGQWRRCCPLGSGAVAGSSIGIDRRIQARELGYDEPSLNALDSTSTRDECVEFLGLAAHAGLHLQSLATDVIAFSQTPFGWTQYPQEFGTGSSMMPNKCNPDAMELLRGEACALQAAQQHAMTLLKGLPSGYNRDLQCIKPIVRDTATQLVELCDMAVAFVGRLAFRADRLAELLTKGAIDATLRMERMVSSGAPLRDAHHAVAKEVREGAAPPAGVSAEAYQTIGSASPQETRRMADAILSELSE